MTILNRAEMVTELEGAEATLIDTGIRVAEQLVKNYLRCNIEQATYTHFLPVRSLDRGGLGQTSLLLPQYPLRSITNIWVDESAMAGEASGAFSADPLTEGDDYHVQWNSDGFSKFARVNRGNFSYGISRVGIGLTGGTVHTNYRWPSIPGSIKVTYTAGWTSDELTGSATSPDLDATAITDAIKLTCIEIIRKEKSGILAAAEGKELTSENLEGWSRSWTADNRGDGQKDVGFSLSLVARALLKDYRRPVV